jgi:ribokinase
MTKSWDVVVVGGVNTDYLVRGTRLPEPGETVEGNFFLQAGGGKGANQAVAAARLGVRVAFIGKVGRDQRGDALAKALADDGIDVSHLSRHRTAASGAALVMVDQSGEKQILTAPGANQELTVADVRRAAGLLSRTHVLLIQFEVPPRVVSWAIRLARQAGAHIVLDPAPPAEVSRRTLSSVDVIRPNASEAKALTGIEVTDKKSARQAATKLLEQGIRAVALQAGSNGDLIVWRGGQCWLPRIPVKTVDATGAGDAFAAALAVAVSEGKSWREAAAFASAAAALTTTKMGAQPALPQRREVVALLRRAGHSRQAAAFER